MHEIDGNIDLEGRNAAHVIGQIYLPAAVQYLDDTFGSNYSIKNPAMLAAFLTCCTKEYHTLKTNEVYEKLTIAISKMALSLSK